MGKKKSKLLPIILIIVMALVVNTVGITLTRNLDIPFWNWQVVGPFTCGNIVLYILGGIIGWYISKML